MNWLYDPCTITWERCRELLTKLTFSRPPNILHNNQLVIQFVLKFYNRSIGVRSSTSPQKQVKSNNWRFSVLIWSTKLYFSLFEGSINDLCELQSYTFYSLKAGSMIQMVSFTGAESTTYFIRWIHELNFIGYNYQQSPTSPMKSKMFPALPRRHGVGSHALGTCYQPRPSPLDTSSHCTLPRFPSICVLPLSFYICDAFSSAGHTIYYSAT